MKKQSKKQTSPMLAAQPVGVLAIADALVDSGLMNDSGDNEPTTAAPVLTKRNRVATSAVLEYTGKKISDRAEHNRLAWDVLAKVLPATAAVLVAELDRAIKAKEVPEKIGPSVYVSYMMRRGALAAKAE